MQKNRKNGFLFFDLLVSLMIVMVFITLIFSSISLLVYHHTVNKQFLVAQEIMSEVLFELRQGKRVKTWGKRNIQNTDFTVTIETINVQHTPFFEVTSMPLSVVTVSWADPREKKFALKALQETEQKFDEAK